MPEETNAPLPAATNQSPAVEDSGTNSARFKELRRALDEEETDYQERLIHVRKGRTNAPSGQPATLNEPSAARTSSGIIHDFLNLFRAPVETFKRVRERLPSAHPAPETAPTNAPPAEPTPSKPPAPPSDNQPRLNDENGLAPSPWEVQSSDPKAGKALPAVAAASPASSGFLETEASAGMVSAAQGQSAALQSAVARMRGALEQNSQMSVSLFHQLADVVAMQNRALDEASRKIEQLNGRIDSLKNR